MPWEENGGSGTKDKSSEIDTKRQKQIAKRIADIIEKRIIKDDDDDESYMS